MKKYKSLNETFTHARSYYKNLLREQDEYPAGCPTEFNGNPFNFMEMPETLQINICNTCVQIAQGYSINMNFPNAEECNCCIGQFGTPVFADLGQEEIEPNPPGCPDEVNGSAWQWNGMAPEVQAGFCQACEGDYGNMGGSSHPGCACCTPTTNPVTAGAPGPGDSSAGETTTDKPTKPTKTPDTKSKVAKDEKKKKEKEKMMEQRGRIPRDPLGSDDTDDLGGIGFPGRCCEGGFCVAVSFASADDDCASLGLSECLPGGGCPEIPHDDDLGPADDFHTHDTGTEMIACTTCDNGYPVGNMFPINPGCPNGWIPMSHNIDPCEEDDNKMITCDTCDNGSPISNMFPGPNCPQGWIPSGSANPCDDVDGCDPATMFNVNAGCAASADLTGNWAGPNGPGQFLINMQNGYSQFGCPFFNARLVVHQGHLSTGIYIGQNHPTGTPMGPAWIQQKQSKVDWLNCIIASCCTNDGGTGGPILHPVGPTMG